MVVDPAEDVGKLCLWIDAVQLRRLDQPVGNRCALPAPLRANEEVVLPASSHGFYGPLGAVVVDLQASLLEMGSQARQAGQGVTGRLREFGFTGDLGELGM